MQTDSFISAFWLAYCLLGLSLLINAQNWQKFIQEFARKENLNLMYTFGFFTLFLGAGLVSVHNVWSFELKVITTLVAWMGLIKGFIMLSFPQRLAKIISKLKLKPWHISTQGLCIFILGLTMLCLNK